MPTLRNRNITIDILKAICITLVVLCHYCPNGMPRWYITITQIIYTFHMPAFMWISGFLYISSLRAEESYNHFIRRKAQRLLLPYIFVSIIIVTIKYLSQTILYVENPVDISSYIKILYLPEAGYFMWYIWALVLIFLIVPFFKSTRSRLLLLFFSTIPYLFLSNFPKLFCIDQAIRFLPYFALGMTCADFLPQIKRITRKITPTSATIFAILLFATVTMLYIYSQPMQNKAIGYLSGITGSIGLICIAYAYQRSNLPYKAFSLLAEASFIIYLFHTTFQGFGKAIIPKLAAYGINISPEFDMLTVFSLTMMLCIVLYYVLRFNKTTAQLFSLKYISKTNNQSSCSESHL